MRIAVISTYTHPTRLPIKERSVMQSAVPGWNRSTPNRSKSMNKGQNCVADTDEVIRRCFGYGVLLSFGLLVGSDGDTNEYLEKLPEYLSDLHYFNVTFLGIVCPYPETPFFRQLQREQRMLPGTVSRDYDGYTLCHRPIRLHPAEAVDHFRNLCRKLGSLTSVARHYSSKLLMSNMPRYKSVVLVSGPEILSIRTPASNSERKYIAGFDAIEEWDAHMMRKLEIPLQYLS